MACANGARPGQPFPPHRVGKARGYRGPFVVRADLHGRLGQSVGAEYDQRYDEDDEDFKRPNAEETHPGLHDTHTATQSPFDHASVHAHGD